MTTTYERPNLWTKDDYRDLSRETAGKIAAHVQQGINCGRFRGPDWHMHLERLEWASRRNDDPRDGEPYPEPPEH